MRPWPHDHQAHRPGTRPALRQSAAFPIQCLLTFEALARLRSVTLAAEEQCVTPAPSATGCAIARRNPGHQAIWACRLSLTVEGIEYLAHVREGSPACRNSPHRRPCRKAQAAPGGHAHVSRSILIPRLRQFTDAYPEIDLTLQVSIPLLDVVAGDADLMVRFGPGRYADLEHICLMKDESSPGIARFCA